MNTGAPSRREVPPVVVEPGNGAARASGALVVEAVRLAVVEPGPLRLALRVDEAAASLGMSRDSFEVYVLPEVRVVRRGRLVLVPIAELERWLEEQAARTLEVNR